MTHLSESRLRAISQGDEPLEHEAEHLLDCCDCEYRLESSFEEVDKQLIQLSHQSEPLRDIDVNAGETRLLLSLKEDSIAPKSEIRRVASINRSVQSKTIRWSLAVAACFALVVGTYFFSKDPSKPLGQHARVVRFDEAQIAVVQTGEDEMVSLHGRAEFAVQSLKPGQRFRVKVKDDEVEVRGTKFTVISGAQGVEQVAVTEGAVEVRTTCCAPALVHPGETWVRPSSTVATTDTPAPTTGSNEPVDQKADQQAARDLAANTDLNNASPANSTHAPPSNSPAVAPGSPTELAASGLAAFDRGDYASAASLLEKAIASDATGGATRDAKVLVGAARVLMSPAGSIPNMGVGVASFDVAATRAARNGDSAKATAAQVGAARKSQGETRKKRFCALVSTAGQWRSEAEKECSKLVHPRRCSYWPRSHNQHKRTHKHGWSHQSIQTVHELRRGNGPASLGSWSMLSGA